MYRVSIGATPPLLPVVPPLPPPLTPEQRVFQQINDSGESDCEAVAAALYLDVDEVCSIDEAAAGDDMTDDDPAN